MATTTNNTSGNKRDQQNELDQPGDTRPYLCIPYWITPRPPENQLDIGVIRPLPDDIISYDCPSIHASPYKPGNILSVNVDVRNSGGGSASPICTVNVYWADPTVGFATANHLGTASVLVPLQRDPLQLSYVTTPTISKLIPKSAPDHICLLACVSHMMDAPKTKSIDPIGDRHWAQHNLIAVSSAEAEKKLISFTVGNPFETEELFELVVDAPNRQLLTQIALRAKSEPSDIRAEVELLDEFGHRVANQNGTSPVRLTLRPFSRRRFSLVVRANNLEPNRVTAIQALLYRSRDQQRLVGSLGIVINRGD